MPRIRSDREGGQIVTTASVLRLFVSSGNGIYSVSKFAAVGIMEVLRTELAAMNIGASVICPGPVMSNIGVSNRNRPDSAADAVSPSPDQLKEDQTRAIDEQTLASLMDPIEAGRLVLRGIRNNDLYILTHPEFGQGIRDRSEALIASIPEDVHLPQAYLLAERGLLRNTMYITERDRRRCRAAVKSNSTNK